MIQGYFQDQVSILCLDQCFTLHPPASAPPSIPWFPGQGEQGLSNRTLLFHSSCGLGKLLIFSEQQSPICKWGMIIPVPHRVRREGFT